MSTEEFESVQLTPVEIRNQEFGMGIRGYSTAEVEDFRNRVADAMERLLRERAMSEERIANYREQLRAFREREKAMSEALVAAQELRSQVERAAQQQMDGILREAEGRADQIMAQARVQDEHLRRDVQTLRRQMRGYLAAFRSLLERHLGELEALEARDREDLLGDSR